VTTCSQCGASYDLDQPLPNRCLKCGADLVTADRALLRFFLAIVFCDTGACDRRADFGLGEYPTYFGAVSIAAFASTVGIAGDSSDWCGWFWIFSGQKKHPNRGGPDSRVNRLCVRNPDSIRRNCLRRPLLLGDHRSQVGRYVTTNATRKTVMVLLGRFHTGTSCDGRRQMVWTRGLWCLA
jgi:hypothetical protein